MPDTENILEGKFGTGFIDKYDENIQQEAPERQDPLNPWLKRIPDPIPKIIQWGRKTPDNL